MADEMGRLMNGRGANSNMPTGTETIFPIPVTSNPAGRKATYACIVCADRPENENPPRVRLTVGGDQIDFPGNVSTKTSGLTTMKIHLNSVISMPEAHYMTGDFKDFYLGTPMDHYEYIRIHCSIIPETIMEQYNLDPLIHDGYVYFEIRKGMYGRANLY